MDQNIAWFFQHQLKFTVRFSFILGVLLIIKIKRSAFLWSVLLAVAASSLSSDKSVDVIQKLMLCIMHLKLSFFSYWQTSIKNTGVQKLCVCSFLLPALSSWLTLLCAACVTAPFDRLFEDTTSIKQLLAASVPWQLSFIPPQQKRKQPGHCEAV